MAAVAAVAVLTQASPSWSVSTEQLLFLEAWRAVDRAYVDKGFNNQNWFKIREVYLKTEHFDNRDETYTAIRKLLASLDDPFTRLLEPARLERLKRGTGGSVTGIGVEVSFDATLGRDSELVVVSPLPGGAAEAGGVLPGDIITAVDGKPTKGISLYEASEMLQGPEGTQLVLTVRSGRAATREVPLSRKRVVVNPVVWAACSGISPSVGAPATKLGYIKVSTFSSKTVDAFVEALQELREQGAADALVLDLRNNGGGLFKAGVDLGKLLMDKGDIVLIADSKGVRDIYSTDRTAIEATAPLVVLVNKGTASASEVLAGALKDNLRGRVVGSEQTFGKGLIQTVVDLSDGSGLAVTVARYQTPSGIDINKLGVTPDLKLTPEQMPPQGPAAFCKAMASPTAPRLFL